MSSQYADAYAKIPVLPPKVLTAEPLRTARSSAPPAHRSPPRLERHGPRAPAVQATIADVVGLRTGGVARLIGGAVLIGVAVV
ncbi:hypothetical protein ACRAKI_20405 [Saccharothrix isguenensis]